MLKEGFAAVGTAGGDRAPGLLILAPLLTRRSREPVREVVAPQAGGRQAWRLARGARSPTAPRGIAKPTRAFLFKCFIK